MDSLVKSNKLLRSFEDRNLFYRNITKTFKQSFLSYMPPELYAIYASSRGWQINQGILYNETSNFNLLVILIEETMIFENIIKYYFA